MEQKKKLTGVIFALICASCFGISGIVDKIGAGHFTSSIVFSTQSVLFSFIFVTIFTLFYFKNASFSQFTNISHDIWKNIIFAGLFGSGLAIIFRFLGLTETTGTFATITQVVTTAVTAILAFIFLRERLPKLFWFLFFIILVAIYFVSIGSFTLTTIQKGDWYILFGTLFVALANIFSKLAVNKVNPIVLAEGRFFVATCFLVAINIVFFHETASLFTFSLWSVFSGLFWASNIIAFNIAIQRIGVTFTTLLLMTAPILTMILEYLILKQTFNAIQITAAIVVVISGLVMVITKNKKEII